MRRRGIWIAIVIALLASLAVVDSATRENMGLPPSMRLMGLWIDGNPASARTLHVGVLGHTSTLPIPHPSGALMSFVQRCQRIAQDLFRKGRI